MISDKNMTNRKYQQYLKSKTWREIRAKVIKNAGGKCEICGSRKRLVVHHMTYRDGLGNEKIENLKCLCEDCHNVKYHNGSPRGLPRKERQKRKKERKRMRKERERRWNWVRRQESVFHGQVHTYSQEEIEQYLEEKRKADAT